MTKVLWRIGTVTPDHTADDMSGKGAEKTGGRWNSRGTPVVYTSENIALATLETIAHIGAGDLPLNRYLVKIEVPTDVYDARQVADPPPVGWDAEPAGLPSSALGDAWANRGMAALLDVPSVIVPDERNVLINPRHADARKIKAQMVRKWIYDPRLRKVEGAA